MIKFQLSSVKESPLAFFSMVGYCVLCLGLVALYGSIFYPAGTAVLFGHMSLYAAMYGIFIVAMAWLVSAFWGDAFFGGATRPGKKQITKYEAGVFSLVTAVLLAFVFFVGLPRQLREVDGFVRNRDSGVPVEEVRTGLTTYLVCGGNFLSVDPVLAMALRP